MTVIGTVPTIAMPGTVTLVEYHWVVMRHHDDCHDRIARDPLVCIPGTPPSNVWICQQAMVTLQKRGHRVYMTMIETRRAA